MRILVTGNLGYNGPLLVQELKSRGHFVIGYDNGYFLDNSFMPIRPFLPDAQVIKDIRRLEKSDLDGFGIEKIVHLAALSNDPMGELSPEHTFQINTEGTKRLFGIAGEIGVRQFVYASSCSIYGKLEPGKLADEGIPLEPLTAYAKSKAASEEFLSAQTGGTKVAVMRYATMFGVSPMLRLDLVVNSLVAYALLYGKASILSDGTPWRPILHVRDFARITAQALEKDVCGTYNVGFNSMNFQVKGIGEEVSRLTGAPLSINPQKTPDERSYKVDFSKIAKLIGSTPAFGLEKGIAELSQAYKKYGLSKTDFESGKFTRMKMLKKMVDEHIISKELEF